MLLGLFWRDLLPNAISRGRYFFAAEAAAGAGMSFPLADWVLDTSFPSDCSIRFQLLKAWFCVIASLTLERILANSDHIVLNLEEVIWIVFSLSFQGTIVVIPVGRVTRSNSLVDLDRIPLSRPLASEESFLVSIVTPSCVEHS